MSDHALSGSPALLEFSYELDQMLIQNQSIMFEQVLDLIQQCFGYSFSWFALYQNQVFYRIVYQNKMTSLFHHYMQGYHKKDPISSYVTANTPFADPSAFVVYRSSDILKSASEEQREEYMQYLEMADLRYLALAPVREYRISLAKTGLQGDFSDDELELISEMSRILYSKYQIGRRMIFDQMIDSIKNDIINESAVGVIILNSVLEIIDTNEAVTRYLKPMKSQILTTAYFSTLVEEQLRDNTLQEPVRICDCDAFVEGAVAELSMRVFTNQHLYGRHYNYGYGFFYVITVRMQDKKESEPSPGDDPFQKYALSRREREIAEYLLTGAKNDEIAKALFISSNTVRAHIKNIYAKMNINSQRALLALFNRYHSDRN